MPFIIDTSSIIHAWDTYPESQFPKVWQWIAEELKSENLIIFQTAFDELASPDLRKFIKSHTKPVPVTSGVVEKAKSIEGQLGIKNGIYAPKGVSENDIFIIAHAALLRSDDQNVVLLTEESEQAQLPKEQRKYKIPAVCREVTEPSILCENFLTYLKQSKQVF